MPIIAYNGLKGFVLGRDAADIRRYYQRRNAILGAYFAYEITDIPVQELIQLYERMIKRYNDLIKEKGSSPGWLFSYHQSQYETHAKQAIRETFASFSPRLITIDPIVTSPPPKRYSLEDSMEPSRLPPSTEKQSQLESMKARLSHALNADGYADIAKALLENKTATLTALEKDILNKYAQFMKKGEGRVAVNPGMAGHWPGSGGYGVTD